MVPPGGDVAGVVETTTSSPTFLDYGRKQSSSSEYGKGAVSL